MARMDRVLAGLLGTADEADFAERFIRVIHAIDGCSPRLLARFISPLRLAESVDPAATLGIAL
jgi:hypothetical protein